MEKVPSSPFFRQSMHADKKQWNRFLSIFLLAAGIGFTVAGIIFFFAYNWDELPKFAKLGIVQILLISSVLFTLFTKWRLLTKQIFLTGATFLIGTLFAVFGQIYQTGADAYDLFLGWTLFTLLWAIAIRFAPLWLIFIGLLCTTIWLYTVQIIPGKLWEVAMLTNAVTWICALATVTAEWMKLKDRLGKHNEWFAQLLLLATVVHAGYLMIEAISIQNAIISIPLISTLLIFSTGVCYGWKRKNLFSLSIIPFTVLMILLSLFINHVHLENSSMFLFSGIIVITGTTLLIYTILKFKKQWYGTEE